MKISISFLFLILIAAHPLTVAAAEPEVIYWNSDAGKALRARIAPDADYWQLIPWSKGVSIAIVFDPSNYEVNGTGAELLLSVSP